MKTILKFTSTLSLILIFLNTNLLFSQPDFWNPSSGPFGGTAREVFLNSNGQLFVGSFNGGIFRSTDGGNNWTEYGLGGKSPYGIAINQAGHIFAGTSHGTYRSTDNGATWELVYFFTLNTVVISSSQYIVGGSQGFGPSEGSIFRSTDNGGSWQAYGPLNTPVFNLTLDVQNEIYAATGDGVYHSTDEGANWTSLGLAGQSIFSIAVDNVGNKFAGSGTGVYKRAYNSGTWIFSSLGNQVNDIKVSSTQIVYAGTFFNGVFKSTNNGDNWSSMNTGLTNPNVWSIGITTTEDVIAGTEGGGIFKFPFGGSSWVQSENGFSNSFVNALAKSPNGNLFAGTGELFGYVYRSTNNGDSWTKLNTGNTSPVSSVGANSSGNIFAGTYGAGIFRSVNNGDNWTQVNSGLTILTINAITFTTAQNIFAAAEGAGVFKSTNNGNNWSAVNTGLTNFSITSLITSSSNILYAGSYGGGIFSSTNEGDLWTTINSDLPDLQILSLATNSSGHIFAGTEGGGVFRSTNNGSNWTPLGLNSARVLEMNSAITDNVFAGTNYEGIYRSTNNGNDWTPINGGMSNDIVTSILVNSTGFVFAGTYGNGVFKSINPITGISNISLNVPDQFKLFNNYPNPFNPTTTIKFNLPEESNVKLNVYDMTGREVSVLVNERLMSGSYEYQWNASQFSSGTYFCRMEADGFTEVKKMTLVK